MRDPIFIFATCVILLASILSSCTLFFPNEGEDGAPYLAIDWIERPVYYQDDNPAIPQNPERNFFYKTETGTFDFKYEYEDGFGWEGKYVIKKGEPGEQASFLFHNPKDGRDNYYTLLLSYHGTDFSNEYRKHVASKQHPDHLDNYLYYEIRSGDYVFQVHKKPLK